MSASIIVVDDEPDVAELFLQRFRREARQGTYVMLTRKGLPARGRAPMCRAASSSI